MAAAHQRNFSGSSTSSADTLQGSVPDSDTDSYFAEKTEARRLLDDIEAQPAIVTSKEPPTAPEYRVPTRTKLAYLALYFLLNLALTIYNKAILGTFEFPWLLTTLHATSASIGCAVLLSRGVFTLTTLNVREHLVLTAFSFLFTLNIAMSNVSLALVSIPFHQIMRSTTPLFAILIYKTFYSRTYSSSTYLSLVPLVLGVGFATYGDYYFTTLGFLLTLLGTVLASVKTIATNRLMTGHLALPALEVLLRMSPLAALQSLAFSWVTGEVSRFCAFAESGRLSTPTIIALVGNGLIAFALNVSSFQTNRLAGALTVTVCGNVKQCLTILLGIALFDVKVGLLNGFGMALAIAGAAWYSMVELKTKKRQHVRNAGSLSELTDRPMAPAPSPIQEPGNWSTWVPLIVSVRPPGP